MALKAHLNLLITPPGEFPGDLLKILQLTPTGRGLLGNFLPLLFKKEAQIMAYPPDVLKKLILCTTAGHPVGGAFTSLDGVRTVFLDPYSPLAVLAPILIHEITHALDEDLWRVHTQSLPAETISTTLLQSEYKAYENQFRFLGELRSAIDGYGAYLLKHYPHVDHFHHVLTKATITRRYTKKAA